MRLPSRLVLITNRLSTQLPLRDVVAQSLDSGCRWVLVREKDMPDALLLALVQELMELANPHGAAVSVSTNLSVAAACHVQGIHLPRGASPSSARKIVGENMLIGVSTHSLAEAQQASEDGADYVFLSPVFLTASKPGYGPALGLNELHRIVSLLPIPVIALGGVTPKNAGVCLQAGAFGVAVMGTIIQAAKPGQMVKNILQNLELQREKNDTHTDESSNKVSHRIR